jgi:hypothetical protein
MRHDAVLEATTAHRGVWQGDFVEPEEWRHYWRGK